MFPLDALSQAVPAYRVAGRFGVDVLGLLWPAREGAGGEGVGLCAYADLSRPSVVEELFGEGSPPPRVSRAALRDHALVVRARGEFFSTDELALSQVRRRGDHWSIDLEVTRVESLNGVPAPRDLYVVLSFNAGVRPPRSLELRFGGRRRDSQGNETRLGEPAAPTQSIEFSD